MWKSPTTGYLIAKIDIVILLWWAYKYWFLLVFWILRVHERGAFMPNSSVFIFLILRSLYRMIYKNPKLFFGKNSLNVLNVKLLSISIFNVFSFFMHFCWEWHLALYIWSDFPGSGTSAASMTSTASTTSVASMTSTASFH